MTHQSISPRRNAHMGVLGCCRQRFRLCSYAVAREGRAERRAARALGGPQYGVCLMNGALFMMLEQSRKLLGRPDPDRRVIGIGAATGTVMLWTRLAKLVRRRIPTRSMAFDASSPVRVSVRAANCARAPQ